MKIFNSLADIADKYGKLYLLISPSEVNAPLDASDHFLVYCTDDNAVFLLNDSLNQLSLSIITANLDKYKADILRFANKSRPIDKHFLIDSFVIEKVKSDVILNQLEVAKDDDDLNLDDQGYQAWDELLTYCDAHDVSDIHISVERANTHIKVRVNKELRPYGGEQNFEKINNLFSRVYSLLGSKDGIITGKNFNPKSKQDATLYRNINNKRLGVRWVSLTKDGTDENYSIKCRFLGDQKKTAGKIPLNKLGFILNQPQLILENVEAKGMNLVIGETSSGKSVTLVNILLYIYEKAQGTRSVYSFENPIERRIEGVEQYTLPTSGDKSEDELMQMVKDILAFFYRADPESVAVGEIRDSVSVKAGEDLGNTGHNVHATLHCESGFDVPERLVSLGGNAKLVNNCLNLCIAQSLLKGLCPDCCYSVDDISDPESKFEITSSINTVIDRLIEIDLDDMIDNIRFRNYQGCPSCNPSNDSSPLYGLGRPQLVAEVTLFTKELIELLVAGEIIAAERLWLSNKNITKVDVALYKANKGLIDLQSCQEVIGDIRNSYVKREKYGLTHFDPLVG